MSRTNCVSDSLLFTKSTVFRRSPRVIVPLSGESNQECSPIPSRRSCHPLPQPATVDRVIGWKQRSEASFLTVGRRWVRFSSEKGCQQPLSPTYPRRSAHGFQNVKLFLADVDIQALLKLQKSLVHLSLGNQGNNLDLGNVREKRWKRRVFSRFQPPAVASCPSVSLPVSVC